MHVMEVPAVLDGVYIRDKSNGRLVFHALGTPTRAEVATVAGRAGARIEKILQKAGRTLDPEMIPPTRSPKCAASTCTPARSSTAATGASSSDSAVT
jgi:hypothetical protein